MVYRRVFDGSKIVAKDYRQMQIIIDVTTVVVMKKHRHVPANSLDGPECVWDAKPLSTSQLNNSFIHFENHYEPFI